MIEVYMYIKEEFDNLKEAKRFFRKNVECYLDPIRKKLIQITPEEKVRQKTISYLIDKLNIEKELMQVEIQLKDYGISTLKRADIIIEQVIDEVYYPLIVVECKAEQVELTDRVLEQVVDYADMINAPFVIVTNGNELEILEYDEKENKYYYLNDIPIYDDLVNRKVKRDMTTNNSFIRTSFNKLSDIEYIEKQDKELGRYMIGVDSCNAIKPFTVNIGECFLDISKRIPAGEYNGIKIVEDIGLRYMSYGNSGGGTFPGLYRTLIIEDKNRNAQMISFMISSYESDKKEGRKGVSVLIVAIDDFEKSHNSLQLRLEDGVNISKNTITIVHNGRITVGNKGRAKREGLFDIIDNIYPELIENNKVVLGNLKNNVLYYMDDKDIINLVTNLIKYALSRDKYREFIKNSIK